MIIRLKDRKNGITDFMTEEADIDYWIDTEKGQLRIRFDGKTYTVKRGKYEALAELQDRIAEELEKGSGFLDLS